MYVLFYYSGREERDTFHDKWMKLEEKKKKSSLNLTSATLRLRRSCHFCAIDTPEQTRTGGKMCADIKGTLAALNMITRVKLEEIPPQR